jgi:hypothetical protein
MGDGTRRPTSTPSRGGARMTAAVPALPWPGQGWETLAAAHGPLSRLLASCYRWASLQDCQDAVSSALVGLVEDHVLPASPDVQRYLFQRARFTLWERWRQTQCRKRRPVRRPRVSGRWSDPSLYVRRIEAWHECLFYLQQLAPAQVAHVLHALDSGPGRGQSALGAYATALGTTTQGIKHKVHRVRRQFAQQRQAEEARYA